jgi:2-polyprenyl-3-methyl-5-hydroxy-6-metoxy-1,4-benzoquinol methylase
VKALQEKWDAIYRRQNAPGQVSELLTAHQFLLPDQGKALDLACGGGANALWLAAAGLQTDAWDISSAALENLQNSARSQRLRINTRQCDISPEMMPVNAYEVIVISRFLDRSLCNAIMMALKYGGLLFYQTFTLDKCDRQGPANPEYLLTTNELLSLFKPLTLVYYQEYARIGNLQRGDRDMAYYIGQKPYLEQV